MLPTTIKIVIADDHYLIRNGFRRFIEHDYPCEVQIMDEAANGADLINIVEKYRPEMVITDIQMPQKNGIDACRIIKSKHPEITLIAYSMFYDTKSIMGMIQAGANGYLVKTSDKEEIIEAIRTVHSGKSYYCSTVSQKIYGQAISSTQMKQNNKPLEFSTQEIKVIQLICKQYCTKEIANQMRLAARTVENYRSHIQQKIGAKNMVGIALYAVIHEIVKFNELM